ncbi:MAG: hypothetical protein ACFHXK_11225 [bacterium]
MRIVLLMVAFLVLTACGGAEPNTPSSDAESAAATGAEAVEALPPGFTDEPPPPPTSDTTVFSGGTLLLEESISDAVVVISNNTLISWGRRGNVDLPNDSVGMDMRGKWIVGGVAEDLAGGQLTLPASLTRGEPARLLVFNSDPAITDDLSEALYAIVDEDGIQVFENESD